MLRGPYCTGEFGLRSDKEFIRSFFYIRIGFVEMPPNKAKISSCLNNYVSTWTFRPPRVSDTQVFATVGRYNRRRVDRVGWSAVLWAVERNKVIFGDINCHLSCYTPISRKVNAMLESPRVQWHGKFGDARRSHQISERRLFVQMRNSRCPRTLPRGILDFGWVDWDVIYWHRQLPTIRKWSNRADNLAVYV